MINKEKAFSLIEVIAAVIILEMITLTLLGLLSLNNAAAKMNEDRFVVQHLLQRKAEEIRAKDFVSDVSEMNAAYAEAPAYTFNVSQLVPYDGNGVLKKITIVVSWTTPGGIPKQLQLVFVVANHS